MDKIKPVAWALRTDDGRLDFNGCELEPTQADRDADEARGYEYVNLYDQSAIDALRAEVERLSAALQKIASDEWEPGCGFCHPEGCESPSVARAAMQRDA